MDKYGIAFEQLRREGDIDAVCLVASNRTTASVGYPDKTMMFNAFAAAIHGRVTAVVGLLGWGDVVDRGRNLSGPYPAAASFHGGTLATDSDLSPQRLTSRIASRIHFADADHDDSYPPEMAARLERALSDANVDHRCEIYPEALHGWTMTDFPVYNEAAPPNATGRAGDPLQRHAHISPSATCKARSTNIASNSTRSCDRAALGTRDRCG